MPGRLIYDFASIYLTQTKGCFILHGCFGYLWVSLHRFMISAYLRKVVRMRVAPTKFGPAPHKPVLVLTLIELIDKGLVADNKFFITPEFVATFKENWALLVNTENNCDFSQPFHYLQSDGFWQVLKKDGKQLNGHIKSILTLIEEVDYAFIDEALFQIWCQPENRQKFNVAMLTKYFPGKAELFFQAKNKRGSWFNEIENGILNEPAEPYLPVQEDEDLAFVRSATFQKVVLRVYNYTCCISGMRVIPMGNHSMIDACHIVPFSESGDNSINNGIALCPNLHRAFDRNLIVINQDYRVIVNENFHELENHQYSLRQFHGRKILLPEVVEYWPGRERLRKGF